MRFSRSFEIFKRYSSSMTLFQHLQNTEAAPAVIISRKNEIHFNLALESYLVEVVKPKVPLFFWWRNDRNVVIGRYQNPWKECDLNKMAQDKVELARRFTGGGAVYQDLGNSVFSFLIPIQKSNVQKNNQMILDVLKEVYGIYGEASGRNDLVANKRKFSGAAFKLIKDPIDKNEGIALHHGTLLLNVNLSALNSYLTPHQSKLECKGVSSVQSRVINLTELNPAITHENLEQALIHKFFELYSEQEKYLMKENRFITVIDSNHEVAKNIDFQRYYKLLKDWTWRFGATPRFAHQMENRFDWGFVDININVPDGYMRDIKIFTDTLYSDLIPLIETAFTDQKYNVEGIQTSFQNLKESVKKLDPQVDCYNKILTELHEWILKKLKE